MTPGNIYQVWWAYAEPIPSLWSKLLAPARLKKTAPDRTPILLSGAALDGFPESTHVAPPEKGLWEEHVNIRLHGKPSKCQAE
jgi:hypothetical protein